MENILVGVFSGILTFILLEFLKFLFNEFVTPWYQKQKYRGLNISGDWVEIHEYEDLVIEKSTINISQNGYDIKGRITLVKQSKANGKDFETQIFLFKGEYFNNYLNINSWNENKKQLGTNNYLLKIKLDGRELEGVKSYYDVFTEKIMTSNVSWNRSLKGFANYNFEIQECQDEKKPV